MDSYRGNGVFYAVSRIICFIVDRKITKAEEQEEAERLEKEKERLEAEEKEATEGKMMNLTL